MNVVNRGVNLAAFSNSVTPSSGTFTVNGNLTATGAVQSGAGAQATPGIAVGAVNTGWYVSGGGSLTGVIGGSIKLSITSGAGVRYNNGNAADPSRSFLADTDTGPFRVAEDEYGISAGGREAVSFDDVDAADTSTMRLFISDGAASGSKLRVTVGAADSGGAGYRVLRVPN